MADSRHQHDRPHDGGVHPEKRYWLDDKANVSKVYYTLVTVCALLFGIDLFFHKHAEFPVESWFGFYPIFGFVGAFGLVMAAKVLRLLVMRPESYYDYEFEELED